MKDEEYFNDQLTFGINFSLSRTVYAKQVNDPSASMKPNSLSKEKQLQQDTKHTKLFTFAVLHMETIRRKACCRRQVPASCLPACYIKATPFATFLYFV